MYIITTREEVLEIEIKLLSADSFFTAGCATDQEFVLFLGIEPGIFAQTTTHGATGSKTWS